MPQTGEIERRHAVEEGNRITFGYPEFSKVFCAEYDSLIRTLGTVEKAVNETFSTPGKEPLHRICRHLAKAVANSFSAVLLLCGNGFGPDAMKIVRGMFESTLTIMYLKKHPKELQDFMDYHWISAMKRQRDTGKYAPELLKQITPEAIEAIENGYARVADRFRNKNGKVRLRWSRKSLFEIAADVGMDQHYFTVYGFGSALQHGDMSGIGMQLDQEPGILDVDIAPSKRWIKEALISAYTCFVTAMFEYIDLARPEISAIKEELLQAQKSALN